MTKLTRAMIDKAQEAVDHAEGGYGRRYQDVYDLIAAAREQLGQQAAAPVVEQVERAYVDFRNSYAPIAGTSVLKHFDKLGAAIATLAVAPPPANKSFHSDAFKMASDKALADRKFVRDALEAVAPPPVRAIPREPTDAMLEAQFGKWSPRECWIAMYDAALSTPPVRPDRDATLAAGLRASAARERKFRDDNDDQGNNGT